LRARLVRVERDERGTVGGHRVTIATKIAA
jgi:hypothetical protein